MKRPRHSPLNGTFLLGLLVLPAVLCAGYAIPSVAHAQRVGDEVVVIKRTPQTCGRNVIGHFRPGHKLRVHLVYRDQLLVSDDFAGWIRRTDVIPQSEAIAHFTAAIEADPKSADWLTARAACYARGDQEEKAQADVAHALEIAPNDPVALLLRSQLRKSQGDYEGALEDAKKSLESDPNSLAARLVLFQNQPRLEQSDEAQNTMRQYGALERSSARFVAVHAFQEFEAGNYELAFQGLADAIHLNPLDDTAFHLRGRWRASQEHYSLALPDLDRAIALKPTNAITQYYRAVCHVHLGNIDLALTDTNESIRQNPNDAHALSLRAAIHYQDMEWQAVIDDATKCIAINPLNADPFKLRGGAYDALGRSRDALADAKALLAIEPTSAHQDLYEAAKRQVMPLRRADSWVSKTLRGKSPPPSGEFTPFADDRVVVIHDATPLRRGKATIDSLQPGQVLRVQLVWRDQLLVSNGQPGWIQRGNVVRLPDAESWFTNEIAKVSPSAELFRARASVRLENHKQDLALADIARVLKISPQNLDAIALRAEIWLRRREWQNALEDADLMLAIDPENFLGHLIRGKAQRAHKQYAEAIESFTRAISSNPHSCEPWAARAVAKLHLDDASAANDAATALQLDRYQDSSWIAVAAIERSARQEAEVMQYFNRAVAIDPNFYSIGIRSEILHSQADNSIAEAAINELILLDPADPKGHLLRLDARWQREDWEGAYDDIARILALDPSNRSVLALHAVLLLLRGQFSEAVVASNTVFESSPHPDRTVFVLRGMARLVTDDPRGALDDLERAPTSTGEISLFLHYTRALACLNLRDGKRAAEELDALQLENNASSLHLNAMAHLLQRDFEIAVRDCDASLRRKKYQANVLLTRGVTKLLADDPRIALQDLNEALRLKCSAPEIAHLARSKARAALGDVEGAEQDLETARQINPNLDEMTPLIESVVAAQVDDLVAQIRAEFEDKTAPAASAVAELMRWLPSPRE